MTNIETTLQQQLLFSYWEKIPFLVGISLDEVHILNDPVRLFIFKYMRDGVEELFPGTSSSFRRRHAFSIKELHEAYNRVNGKYHTVSVQNFHHHVNKLLEINLIFEVTKILEGRHYIRYFGRVGKTLDNPFDKTIYQKREQLIINPLKDLIAKLNPELGFQKITTLVDNYHSAFTQYHLKVYSWIQENYDVFYDSQIDLQNFIFFSPQFAQYSLELRRLQNELAKLLKFETIDDYSPISLRAVADRKEIEKNLKEELHESH